MNVVPARGLRALACGAGLSLTCLAVPPAVAVNADHGDQLVSVSPSPVTPHVMNGAVEAITQLGTEVVAAGTFTSVSPAGTFRDTSDDLVRHGIFAFDATTGAIDTSFDPDLGGAANSLDTDGTSVYVGGSFGSVGGKSAIKRVVKLDADGHVVTTFKAQPNAAVNDVVVRGSRLYVGGAFTSIKRGAVKTRRSAFAALDTTTGKVLDSVDVPFSGVYDSRKNNPGTTNVKRFDVTADGSHVVAVGNFSAVGGLARAQVAVLDTGGDRATVDPWATTRLNRAHNSCAGSFDSFTRDVDFSPDGSYFVLTTTGAFAGGAASGTLCDTTSRWETASTGNKPTWVTYTGGDTTYGVAVTGSAVYVGGHMRWEDNPFQGDQAGPGAVARKGIAALDPVNGMPLAWNPGRARGVGAKAMFATAQGLWVGSDTTLIHHQRRGRIAFLPLAGGTTVPAVGAADVPGDLFAAGAAGSATLARRPADASGAPSGAATTVDATFDWSKVRGAFLVGHTLYYGRGDGGLYQRSFDPRTCALGTESAVNLYDDPDTGARIPFPIASVTGMFYEPGLHRLYYTVQGDPALYYRYFTPQSAVVGALTFTASNGGVSFASAAGVTLAGDRLLYGSGDGSLRSVPFSGGKVTGSPTVVSSDGSWADRGLFLQDG